MLSALMALAGPFIPYIAAGIAALASVFVYGRKQKRAGRKQMREDFNKADAKAAGKLEEKINAKRNDADGRSAADRLRDTGRLRD